MYSTYVYLSDSSGENVFGVVGFGVNSAGDMPFSGVGVIPSITSLTSSLSISLNSYLLFR